MTAPRARERERVDRCLVDTVKKPAHLPQSLFLSLSRPIQFMESFRLWEMASPQAERVRVLPLF